MGLIDVEKLRYDKKKEPLKNNKEHSSSPHVAVKLPRGSDAENAENIEKTSLKCTSPDYHDENAPLRKNNGQSYRTTAGMQEVGQRREQLPSDIPSLVAASALDA